MSEEKIDAELRALGYDPKEVAVRGQVLAKALIENHSLRAVLAEKSKEKGRALASRFGVTESHIWRVRTFRSKAYVI